MNDISIGAVGAAIIAGLVSVLGLIIGKEQKVSEFRQAWIDDLRKCMIAYLVQINAITDAIRASKIPGAPTTSAVIDSYKGLNEASHGILFRVNASENTAKALIASMKAFEDLAADNANLTPTKIRSAEIEYVAASKNLLKDEWETVKKGESTYRVTKRVVLAAIAVMILLLILLWATRVEKPVQNSVQDSPSAQSIQNEFVCQIDVEGAARSPSVASPRSRLSKRRKSLDVERRNSCETGSLETRANTPPTTQ